MSTKKAMAAKRAVFAAMRQTLEEAGAVNYGGEFDWAIPVTCEGGEALYVTVELTAKNPTTYTNARGVTVKAFNPEEAKASFDAAAAQTAANAAARRAEAEAKKALKKTAK